MNNSTTNTILGYCANPDCIDGKVNVGCAIDAPLITVDCPACKILGRAAIQAALSHAKKLNAETETVFTDSQGTWFGARFDNHPTTAAFELCATCLQADAHEDECPEGYHPLATFNRRAE